MKQGLVLLSAIWALAVLAQEGEGRAVPDAFPGAVAAASTPAPCYWVCTVENTYQCECVPVVPGHEGIAATVLGRTLLQVGPGGTDGVVSTLEAQTRVQVLCKKSDAQVQGDQWWLNVYLLSSAQSGWVPDFWVGCNGASHCNDVPLCT